MIAVIACTYIYLYVIIDFIYLIVVCMNKRPFTHETADIGCTVIIPCRDNEEAVLKTLESIFKQNVQMIEVIVSCNGISRDSFINLKSNILRRFPRADNLYFAYSEKANKSAAINHAIRYSSYDYICVVDADCRLGSEYSLGQLFHNMKGNTIAAGGRIIADEPINRLQKLQQMEYNRTFVLLRVALRNLNSVNLISGAFGVFKKDIVTACGGYDESFVGEDMELTLRMQRYCKANHIPYSVEYDPLALIYTKVHSDPVKLFRQRDRWQRGLIGSYIKNISFRDDTDIVMRLWVRNYMLVYEIFSPYMAVIGMCAVLADFHVDAVLWLNWIHVLIIYVIGETVIDIMAELYRRHLDHNRNKIKIADIILRVPYIMFVESTLLLAAKLLGNITYFRRKNVW